MIDINFLLIVAWRHQSISETNVSLSVNVFCGIHLGATPFCLSLKLNIYICKVNSKIIFKVLLQILEANELTDWGQVTHTCVSSLVHHWSR